MSTAVRTLAATGPAAPQTCWERYDELARWPQWAPQVLGVDAPASRLDRGLTGVVRVRGGWRVAFAVTAVDRPAMTWSWIARLGVLRLTLHHGLAPHPSGTRATLALEGPATVVAVYAPLARLALARLVR